MGGISIWQLLIILAIIVLIFGTKKMRNMGSDLGNALRGFKKAVNNDEDKQGKVNDAEFTQLDEEKITQDKKPKAAKKTTAKKRATSTRKK